MACARDIDAGLSDEDLNCWVDCFKCATVKVKTVGSLRERMWQAHQGREDLVEIGETAKLSPLERIYSIMETKTMLEKIAQAPLGAKALSDQWLANVRVSQSGAKENEDVAMKVSLIDAAVTVHSRMLGDPELQAFLAECEAWSKGYVFNSIYQLEVSRPWNRSCMHMCVFEFGNAADNFLDVKAIVKRAQSKDMIKWCVILLADKVMQGSMPARELSTRKLSGKGQPGGRGLVDLCVAKRELAWSLVKKAQYMD